MDCRHQLIDVETEEVIVAKLEVADTFWRRFRGLQFRAPLAPDQGLLLTPCRSIHTHWMRFAIDVAMLDERGVVLSIRTDVRPFRLLAGVPYTHSVLEVVCGGLDSHLLGRRVQVLSP